MEDKTCDHAFRSCPDPLLVQAPVDFDASWLKYALETDLENRLMLQLVRSPDGHRIYLGNWTEALSEGFSRVLGGGRRRGCAYRHQLKPYRRVDII